MKPREAEAGLALGVDFKGVPESNVEGGTTRGGRSRESPLGTEGVIQKEKIGPLSSGRFPALRNENCQKAQNGNLGLSVTKARKRSREMASAQSRIMLRLVNPDFMPTVLTGTDEGGLQVVADLVEVLRAAE